MVAGQGEVVRVSRCRAEGGTGWYAEGLGECGHVVWLLRLLLVESLGLCELRFL